MSVSPLAALRQPDWMSPARMTAYRRIFLGAALLLAAIWIVLSRHGVDPGGKPLGTDFLSFYAASKLALDGAAADAWRPAVHAAAEIAVFGRDLGYAAFFYPPPFLLVCLPLALVPYLAALMAWLGATGIAYLAVLRLFLRDTAIGLSAAIAFPAVLLNLGHGQNGFLTTALLGAAAWWLGPRPVLAGFMIGGLAIKPQLAVLLPFGLAFIGAWRTVAAAALATLAVAALSWLVLGEAAWRGFLEVSPLARLALENDWVGAAKMTSVFAAARLLGADLAIAYGAQVAAVALALAGLWRLARRRPDPLHYGVALVAATPLASPFLLDYDLMLLAIPLAWLLREGLRTGFRPWEQVVMAAAFLMPLVARSVATLVGLPLVPLVTGALFVLVLRRGEPDRPDADDRGKELLTPA